MINLALGAYLAFWWVDSHNGTSLLNKHGWHLIWIGIALAFLEGFIGAMFAALFLLLGLPK